MAWRDFTPINGHTLGPGERLLIRRGSIINQELGRLDGLVGRLIELSKIEHRHAVFDRRNVSVADIVADALASFDAVKVGSEVELCVKMEKN